MADPTVRDGRRKVEIDDMLAHAGDFGRYQYLLMFLFAILNVLSSFHYFGALFVGVVPEHWCHVAELSVDLYDEATRDLWTPDVARRRCYRYDVNMTGMTDPVGRGNWSVRPCDHGWEYDKVWGYDSIATEMNWVCDDLWRSAFGMSMFFVGCVIGTLCLGIMADRIGRLHVLVIANMIAMVGNVATSFTIGFSDYAFYRFFAGMATDNNFVMFYIIVLEYMRPSRRTLGLNLTIGVFYTIGCVALPWIALAVGNWRPFILMTALPLMSLPCCYYLVPESARWLLSQGQVDRAVACFKRVARFNGRTLDVKVIEDFKQTAADSTAEKPSSTPSLLGLFRTPRLRRKTCILIFKSIVLTLSYDVISRNVNGLGFDSFTVFSITSVTTLPACLVILALQDRIGRKAMASGSLAGTGLCLITSAVLFTIRGNQDPVYIVTLSFVARLGINIAYNSGVQYAAELIPTEVRGQGVSAIHMAGYLILFTGPYILLTENYWKALPDLTVGVLALLGALFCLFLPETLNRELPVTLADGEAFGEGEGIWDFACCQKAEKQEKYLEGIVNESFRYN